MIYDGYVPAYTDWQGWSYPISLDGDKVVIYKTSEEASNALHYLKEIIRNRLSLGGQAKIVTTPRKFWFDKIELKIDHLSENDKTEYKRILDTSFVKKVKLL